MGASTDLPPLAEYAGQQAHEHRPTTAALRTAVVGRLCATLGVTSDPTRIGALDLASQLFVQMKNGLISLLRSGIGLAFVGLLLSNPARADEPPSTARIGVLNPQTGSKSLEDALRHGLNQLGYVEGKNLEIAWRRSAGTEADMRVAATALVNSGVDLIVTMGSPATQAALDAGSQKPVIFLVGDPLRSHFAASLAKPGGNATGVSVVFTEMIVKDLELLHELAPRAKRIMFLTNISNPGAAPALEQLHPAAKRMGVRLMPVSAATADQLENVLQRLSHTSTDAVLVSGDLLTLSRRYEVAEAVRRAKLPAIFPFRHYHEAGVLISYGPNYEAAMDQVASYVDRVLRGANPGELPIEQVSKYELVVNVRLARELGIAIPDSVLLRADEVIN